jgi:hypothetical protein
MPGLLARAEPDRGEKRALREPEAADLHLAAFVPSGRVLGLDAYAELLAIPNCIGAKHSSLSRRLEWQRLALRDQLRPDFHVFTGNDLAIDMVRYGSDWLLGLSTAWPEAFARRDAWWAAGDPRFDELDDALQALGDFAFRTLGPAYKHSMAQALHLRGLLASDEPHPESPRRPAHRWQSRSRSAAARSAIAGASIRWKAGTPVPTAGPPTFSFAADDALARAARSSSGEAKRWQFCPRGGRIPTSSARRPAAARDSPRCSTRCAAAIARRMAATTTSSWRCSSRTRAGSASPPPPGGSRGSRITIRCSTRGMASRGTKKPAS